MKVMVHPKEQALQVKVEQLMAEFERIGRLVYEDGVWQCDVGAVFFAELCDRAGMPREIVTGFYRHPTLAAYASTTNQDVQDLPDIGNYDELHSWIIVYGDNNEALLIDPNGELRGERRIQSLVRGSGKYIPLPEDHPNVELRQDIRASELVVEGWDQHLAIALGYLNDDKDV